jgi:nucleotide-binding universal stress UspA family protein
MPYYDPSGALEFAEKLLRPWCEAAHRRNISCDALVREGQATQQIAAAARQFQADRILLGTRSRSKLGKMLLGSVAEQVLRSVNLPVITVGPEAHLPVDAQPRVVLHATTLREASLPSAALACNIAATQGARLILLHVLPPTSESTGIDTFAGSAGGSGQPAGFDSAAMHEICLFSAKAGASCCSAITPVVMHGSPSIEILALAAETHASLIVLASTDRSIFQNLTRNRTIYSVLAHARCPVLTLRQPVTATAHLKEQLSSVRI